MVDTYSPNLALILQATGTNSGTWGDATNTNIGTLLEQAISGYVTQAITDGAATVITIPNGTTGVARNMYLELTGALTAARVLEVPANKKLYFIYNNTTGGYAVTVKVSGQTGVSVPNGKKIILVSNGTDIVEAVNYAGTISGGSLSLTGNLSVGGTSTLTGVATLTAQPILSSLTASQAVFTDGSKGLVSNAITGTGNVVMSASPTLTGTISGANLLLSGSFGLVGDAAFGGQASFTGLASFIGGLTTSGNLTLSGGTANGVLYLNGSKVATSGSGFAYNASTSQNTLYVEGVNSTLILNAIGSVYPGVFLKTSGTYQGGVTNNGSYLQLDGVNGNIFSVNNSEQMRLTSTGLGIGTSSISSKLQVHNTNSDFYVFDQFTKGLNNIGNGWKYIMADQINESAIGTSSGNLIFYNNTSATERMRLDSSGNLGIGTSSPAQKLDVSGNVKFTGNMFGAISSGYWVSGNDTYGAGIYGDSSTGNVLRFQAGSSEKMRLDSSGNLGIGTSSPAAPLQVSYGGQAGLRLTNTAVGNGSDWYLQTLNGGVLRFYSYTASAERLQIDSSGNLGLGVTPSAWSQGKAVEVGVVGNGVWAYSGVTRLMENAYFNSGYKYAAAGIAAAYMTIDAGSFYWNTTGTTTGAAGTTATFTQAMTLDASGNLAVGNTSAARRVEISGASSGETYQLRIGAGSNNSSYTYDIGRSTVDGYLYFYGNQSGANGYIFSGANGERARIDSSGNLIQTVNGTAATLSTNGTMTFSLTNNTTLKVSVRGSDGTTRSANITLA